MQKNLGRVSGPAVMQLGRGRVALYRDVPILFAVLAATSAAFPSILTLTICVTRNFVRHYLWIITSVFSCTFCTFCVPKAQMRVWGDTPLPCCAPPFSRGTASTPLVYADMQKINLHTGESFAIPKIMIVPQTNCLIRLRIKLFFIKACKILLCNAIFCCCMSRYGVV